MCCSLPGASEQVEAQQQHQLVFMLGSRHGQCHLESCDLERHRHGPTW